MPEPPHQRQVATVTYSVNSSLSYPEPSKQRLSQRDPDADVIATAAST